MELLRNIKKMIVIRRLQKSDDVYDVLLHASELMTFKSTSKDWINDYTPLPLRVNGHKALLKEIKDLTDALRHREWPEGIVLNKNGPVTINEYLTHDGLIMDYDDFTIDLVEAVNKLNKVIKEAALCNLDYLDRVSYMLEPAVTDLACIAKHRLGYEA